MLSDDPVLRDFFHSPQHADISGPWRPGSIRDQSVRACLVIDRAVRHGWITKDRPLAIVGAGVAGVTAAILARRHEVSVTIFESHKPLAVQSQSFRWIDPAAYDWPHDWWADGCSPKSRAVWPIQIEAGEARAIALQFADLLHRDPEIRLVLENVSEIRELQTEFNLVADCRGVKAERHRCGVFEGLPFWDRRDPRLIVAEKAAHLGRPARVLISGGGDGAIQDFLLLATGVKSPVELAQAVGLSTAPSPGSKLEFAAFERESLSIEERCWRELCWCDPRDEAKEQRIHEQLDQFYKGWISKLDFTIPRNEIKCVFTLVRRAPWHSACYPLNRLLGILAEREFQPKLLTGDLESLTTLSPADFDIVVIRHGIGSEPGEQCLVRKQALPFAFYAQ